MQPNYDVSCSGCPRTYSMSLSTLSQRKTCTFCGAALILSNGARQALEGAKAASNVPQRLTISCPLCLRALTLDSPLAGRAYTCTYCTCPYALDSAYRPAPRAEPLPFPEPVRDAIARIACPQCNLKKLAPDTQTPAAAKCTSCGAAHDLYVHDLDALLELPAGLSPLVETACTALLARWHQREVGLAEAWWILEELGGVSRALDSKRSVLALLSPLIAVDVIQYGIFGAPSADVLRTQDGVTLVLPQSRAAANNTNVDLTGTLLLNAVGIGLFFTTGRGFIGHTAREEGMQADPALLLHFTRTDDGSDFSASVRNVQGQTVALGRTETEKLHGELSKKLPDAVRRLYVFKSIYGSWISGAMLYGTPASALKNRLQSFGGALARQADALSAALTQLPG